MTQEAKILCKKQYATTKTAQPETFTQLGSLIETKLQKNQY